MSRALVLVTGAGRSGTSTVAGALQRLGVHVPGPHLQANKSNPRGFYESRWSVEFHNRLLKRANVSIADGRPEAAVLIGEAIRDQDRSELSAWLDGITTGHRVTAVKDPRTTWALGLWEQVAGELGIEVRFLVSLRHPAEVIGSRATHYSAGIEVMGETGFAVRNLAGWVNAMLMTERQTRGRTRCFVRYDDLLADWRTTMTAASSDLDITFDADLGLDQPHPVDEFIDPQLSRHRLTWSDVELRPDLVDVASQVWDACQWLADRNGADPKAEADLDTAQARYAAMYLAAQQLSHDSAAAQVTAARRAATRATRRKLAEAGPGSAGATGPGAPPVAAGAAKGRAAIHLLRERIRRVRGR